MKEILKDLPLPLLIVCFPVIIGVTVGLAIPFALLMVLEAVFERMEE